MIVLPPEQLFAADQSISKSSTPECSTPNRGPLHYLHFGEHSFSKEAVDRFLKVVFNPEQRGKIDLAAEFKTCFGCDYREMERELRGYIMSGHYLMYWVPMPKLASESIYPVRAVPGADARLRLAEQSLRVLESGLGELALLNAAST